MAISSVSNPTGSLSNAHTVTATDWNGAIDTLYTYLNSTVKPAIDAIQAAPANPLTTKGDVMTHSGSAAVRLGVGADGTVLTANSAATNGVEWSAAGSASFTAGMIMMWSGSLSSIPSGWALCDGVGGRPNLQGAFIVGSGNVSPGATGGLGLLAQGATGGANTHTHSFTSGVPNSVTSFQNGTGVVLNVGDNVHVHTGTTGSGSNVPVYYALAYIIKT